MMCKYPYIKDPHKPKGVARYDVKSRADATPFPCGTCLPCRINQARVWTHRIMLESKMYPQDKQMFLTLTYNKDTLPSDNQLRPKHLTNFIKRLRRLCGSDRFRYYAVGEYGEDNWRPHYHLLLFGIGPEQHKNIEKVWTDPETKQTRGYHYIGSLTEASARYVIGYVTSKFTKREEMTMIGVEKEFSRSSKQKGGIGATAAREIAKNIKNSGYVGPIVRQLITNGKKMPLGGYLTKIILDELNMENQQKYELSDYQDELYEASEKLEKAIGFFYSDIKEANRGKVEKMEAKYEIFKRKNKI